MNRVMIISSRSEKVILHPRSQELAWERGSLKLCFNALKTLATNHVGSED